MKSRTFLILAAAAALAGCGGQTGGGATGPRTATITGQVLDIDNQPVRGATVEADGRSTITSMTGTFVIEDIRQGKVEVIAKIRDEGQDWIGRTFAALTVGEQRRNVNIVVGRKESLGAIRGVVRDREGFVLENVPVFAYSGAGGSVRDFTDENGEYSLEDLIGGQTYEVMATGQGYRSDYESVTVVARGNRNVDLVLGNPGTPALTAPQAFDVITWVSPYLSRSSGGTALAWAQLNAFPDELKGKPRPGPVTRAIRDDYAVEANLTWTEQRFADHLGWGIYRGTGATGALNGLEFNADPLAGFFQDVGLNLNSTYRYAATTLSSDYPNRPEVDESPLSDIVTARTLNPLSMNAVSLSPTRFSWSTTSGAEEFAVYVFDQSPKVGVAELWRSAIVTGSSVAYGGPALVRGRRYYAFVLGLANSRGSRVVSEIEEFIP